MDRQKVLYTDDVAEILGMSREALRKAWARGTVPAPGRLGRRRVWDRKQFEKWLERQSWQG